MRNSFLSLAFILSFLGASVCRGANPPPVPVSEGTILNIWQFDTTNGISVFGTAPNAWEGVNTVASWSGNAAEMVGATGKIQYPESGPTSRENIRCDHGSVMFWFRPSWNSGSTTSDGPQGYGRFIELGTASEDAEGWWSLYLDPTGSKLYFSGQRDGQQADYLTADINWSSNQWRFVALTYTATNSTLYIDGQVATNGSGVLYWPDEDVRANQGFSVGSSGSGQDLAKGQFEELATFDYPISLDFIDMVYDLTVALYGGSWPFLASSGFASQQAFSMSGGALMSAGLGGCAPSALTFLHPIYQGTNVVLEFTGHDPTSAHDLFTTTNFISWSYFGQVPAGTTNFTVPTLSEEFFLLGTMQDSDNDGVTDAYEKKIALTDPYENLPPLNVFITQPTGTSVIP